MHVVEVGRIKPTVNQHTDELVEDHANLGVDFDKRTIAHEQCAHGLQRRYFDREIERCDDHNRAKWPAVAT